MLLVYLPDVVLPARCPGVWTAPQQCQGSKLSLLMDYFRAVTVGPQSAAWLHSTVVIWSAKKKLKHLSGVCKENCEIRCIITLLQF